VCVCVCVCVCLVHFNDSNFTLLPRCTVYSPALPLSLILPSHHYQSLRGNHWICNLRKSSDIALYYKRAGPRLPPSICFETSLEKTLHVNIFRFGNMQSPARSKIFYYLCGFKVLTAISNIAFASLKINWILPDKYEITILQISYN